MCCTRGLLKIQDAKIRHLRTILQLYRAISLNWHVSTIRKKQLNSNISFTCPHNMVNFAPPTAEIGWRVRGTPIISTGFTFWLRYCTNIAQQRSTKLCIMFGCLLGWLLPPNGILPSAIFTLHPSLAFSDNGSVTAWHLSSGCQPNFAAWYLHTTWRPYRSTVGSRTV